MIMNISKPNDILVATLNNPSLTSYDLISNNINGENTSFFTKDDYKQSDFVKSKFTKEDGEFDDLAFDNAYKVAQQKYLELTDEQYLKDLDKIAYSPFDITRPEFAKTFSVSSTSELDNNPFKVLKGWTGVGSIDQNPLSYRELAQKGKIFDPETNTWLDKSINDLGLLDKFFGDTYVYAQWDDDGIHQDPISGLEVQHKKGEWKFDNNGNLYVERLAGREIYGKQVVNPTDVLTDDGSIFNKFDFMDSDSREKSLTGTAFKIAAEIAPYLIPNFAVGKLAVSIPQVYGGIKAAVGMMGVLPTLYKSIEGIFVGDRETALTQEATQLEGWMSKFNQRSTPDEAAGKLFSAEGMSSMIVDIFSQIYEQRAAASLSKLFYKADAKVNKKAIELGQKINQELLQEALEGKIDIKDIGKLSQVAMGKIPELKSLMEAQSQMSKALSLGYMALTSTADIYGEALESGYGRRVAGVAALAAAMGQYGVMMNNELGTWFLDKTTGYNIESNRAMMKKAITPWLDEIKEGFSVYAKEGSVAGKAKLAGTFGKIKNSLNSVFTTPSSLIEGMWKHSVVEGIEEVTEQAVLDATKGIVDVASYLGLTEKKGSFGGWQNVFSQQGLENYLANFVGGIVGGGLFEFHRSKIAPWLDPSMVSEETQKNMYELVSAGHGKDLIEIINKTRPSLGNKYITPINTDGTFQEAKEGNISQADLIADKAIEMINNIEGILNNYGLVQSDEDIVRKAIRDEIVIKDLLKTRAEGSQVGLEGLVLKDFKDTGKQILNIQSQLNNLPDTEENTQNRKNLEKELKIYTDKINDIQEGKYGIKYFRLAEAYLNKDIFEPLLKISKNQYAKEKYGEEYWNLPDTGLGITKERIDKDWKEFVDSKDLLNDLETAEAVFAEVAKQINKPLADYAKDYNEERKRTFNLILDLKSTFDLFKNSSDPEAQKAAMQQYVEINNMLEKSGIVAPWDVYYNDLYEKLSSIDFIKKISGYDEQGNATQESFTDEELDTANEQGVTKRDIIKNVIQKSFGNFPLNPFALKQIIPQINQSIDNSNKETLRKIQELSAKETLTEEEQLKIEELQNSLIDFKIGSIEDTDEARQMIFMFEGELEQLIQDSGKTRDQFLAYKNLSNPDLYKNTFDTYLAPFGVSSINDLSIEQYRQFVDSIINSEQYYDINAKILKSSENITEVLSDNQNKLSNPDLSEEEFVKIKESMSAFFDIVEKEINQNALLANDPIYANLLKQEVKLRKKLESDIESLEPEIFKYDNYALPLLTEFIKQGSVDKEVFLEAEKLFNFEKDKLISDIFGEYEGVTWENFEEIIEGFENFTSEYEEVWSQLDQEGEDLNGYSIENLIDYSKDTLFINDEFLQFVQNNTEKFKIASGLHTVAASSIPEIYKSNLLKLQTLKNFQDLTNKGVDLKVNPLYDFVRNFVLSLDSNPNSKVNKIFEILQREENILKSGSNINNFMSDGIRQQDIEQAVNYLKIIKGVSMAMSTTTLNYGNPYGYIQAIKNYAERMGVTDDLASLETITSDVATVTSKDLDLLINKLEFYKDFASFNLGKMRLEQEIIRKKVTNILLDNWTEWSKKMDPNFFPLESIKEILASTESNDRKLLLIENLIFDSSVNKKSEVFEVFLKSLEGVNSDDFTVIDKEIKSFKNWDLAIYMASIIGMRSEDFYLRSRDTITNKFSKSPFFTQEFVVRTAVAHTMNPELFEKIYELHPNTSKVDASFITMILGGAGTGKTTAGFGIILDTFRQSNTNTNLWYAAPTDNVRDNLKRSLEESVKLEQVTATGLIKSELFEKLGIKDLVEQIKYETQNIENSSVVKKYVGLTNDKSFVITDELKSNEWLTEIDEEKFKNLPNMLYIDEISHFTSTEIYLLNTISKHSFENTNYPFMKIIAAGDPNQLGALSKVNILGKDSYFALNINNVNAMFGPRLQASIRSSNSQKRLNEDRMKRLTGKVDKIFRESDKSLGYGEAEASTTAYLQTTSELNTLSYYEDKESINGEKIVSSLTKDDLSKIANAISKDSKTILGIITEDGNLPEEWAAMLADSGITNPGDSKNIRLFTPGNVQGSEVDYVIFDPKIVNIYDKSRDVLKGIYTLLSRSKYGTLIVDSEGIMGKFYIFNGKKDTIQSKFGFLDDEENRKAREVRIEDITKLIGLTAKLSKYADFKWRNGVNTEEENDSHFVTNTVELPKDLIPKPLTPAEEDAAIKSDFKTLWYSFYLNPSAKVNQEKETITVVPGAPKFDLNGIDNVGPDKYEKIIQSWANLQKKLIYNLEGSKRGEVESKNTEMVRSSDYIDYFRHIFEGVDVGDNVKIEYLVTVSKYNKDLNDPIKKINFDPEKTLKDGDLFFNITAKLNFKGKLHYISLASFSKLDKLIKKSKEFDVSIEDLVKNKVKELEKALETANVLELDINLDSLEFSTSTVFVEKTKEGKELKSQNTLSNLRKNFPGLKFSEIRFYPGREDEFFKLIRRYTFGKEREFTEESKKKYFENLRNKAYIVVSYDDDLDGDPESLTTKAQLVPISADSRGVDVLIDEVNKLLDERAQTIFGLRKEGKEAKITPELNAKTEVLLNRSDIVDVLILWGKTAHGNGTLLDLLESDIEFTVANELEKTKTSVFKIFSGFRQTSSAAEGKLKDVLDIVKKELKSSNGKVSENTKKNIVAKLRGHKHWHTMFFNIFGYKKLIAQSQDREFFEFVTKDQMSFEEWNESEGGQKMATVIEKLLEPLRGNNAKKFYYSIPIKPNGDSSTFLANEFISGLRGFTPEFFGDKFYIKLSPESGRLFLKFEGFINAKIKEVLNTSESEESKKLRLAAEAAKKAADEAAKKAKEAAEAEAKRLKEEQDRLKNQSSGLDSTIDELIESFGEDVDPKEVKDAFNYFKPTISALVNEEGGNLVENFVKSKEFGFMNPQQRLRFIFNKFDLGVDSNQNPTMLIREKNGAYIVPARILIKKLNPILGLTTENSDVDATLEQIKILFKTC